MTVEPFPQEKAGNPKLSLTAFMVDLLSGYDDPLSPEDFIEQVNAHYPDITEHEFLDALNEATAFVKKMSAEIAASADAMDLVGSAIERHSDQPTVGDALEAAALEGDELAAAALASLMSPESVQFYATMDAAVEADPYWIKTAEGYYQSLPGAIHKTPDELIRAYLINIGDRESLETFEKTGMVTVRYEDWGQH